VRGTVNRPNVCVCSVGTDTVEKDVDDAKLLAVLHSLYSITFTPPGRDAVVTVFALDDNVAVLLPFIEMNGTMSTFLFLF